MLATRIIPCLDCAAGRVVKGVRFANLRDSGDPAELAARYEAEGADEIVLLDISATLEARSTHLHTIERVRNQLSIPLTVGGGIKNETDIALLLQAGADKIALNTAAVLEPKLISSAAERFGSQCVVIAIDAEKTGGSEWKVRIRSGTTAAGKDVIAWAKECTQLGAGELLLTSYDRDGTGNGYDLPLLRLVTECVSIPVIASGGAYDANDLLAGIQSGCGAVLAASMFHEQRVQIRDVKQFLKNSGVTIRL